MMRKISRLRRASVYLLRLKKMMSLCTGQFAADYRTKLYHRNHPYNYALCLQFWLNGVNRQELLV